MDGGLVSLQVVPVSVINPFTPPSTARRVILYISTVTSGKEHLFSPQVDSSSCNIPFPGQAIHFHLLQEECEHVPYD
jgi:hypothetical protein